MNTTFNNKNKTILLISGFLIFLVIVYNVALKQTIEIGSQSKNIEKSLQRSNQVYTQRSSLKKEIAEIDSIIGITHKLISSQEIILNEFVTYCKENRLIVREFPKTHMVNDGDFEIETNVVSVEGTYKELLHLLYFFEHKRLAGKLSSAKFLLNEDIGTHRKYLTLTFYIQNFKTISAPETADKTN
jgi:hypothetical protein